MDHLVADGKQTLWVAHVVYLSSWYCQDDIPVASSAQGARTDRWLSTRQRCQFPLIQHSGEKRQPTQKELLNEKKEENHHR